MIEKIKDTVLTNHLHTETDIQLHKSLNQVIDWINAHEKQSQETLQFRKETAATLKDLEMLISDVENNIDEVESRVTDLEIENQ